MDELSTIFFDLKVWVTIILGFFVNRLFVHTPGTVSGYLKKRRLKNLRKIRHARYNPEEVAYEIAKANSYFLFFLLACLMYMLFLILGPLGEIAENSMLLFAAIISPAFVVEVLWLQQDVYTKLLVKASRCVHVSHQSNTSRSRWAQHRRAYVPGKLPN